MSRLKAPAVLAVVLAGFLAVYSPLPAVAGAAEGITYIRGHQMSDGGFAEPGRSSGADATTAWCIMALRAAGTDPHDVRQGGRSPVDFLASQSGSWVSVTDYERALLAAAAAGKDLRSFGGVDLIAKVQSYQRTGGNIGDAVNSNAFGILSYKAAGLAVPSGAVEWQKRTQNGDGGWGNSPGAASNPDMTGASIMALRAAGADASDPSIRSALDYLHSIQNSDGGFSFQPGSSDVSATAWCVQAIVAAGQEPSGDEWSKNGRTPYGFVASMQDSDGRFYWMEGKDKNPVWTTAYAVCALSRKPFPVGISYTTSPGGQNGGNGGEDTADDQPVPAPGESGQEGETPAIGEEEPGEGSPAPGEAVTSELDDPGSAEAEDEEEALAASKARAAGGDEQGGSSSGSSFLIWLIPLLVAVPLLTLGGWRLYRRYIV